jgi:hypothetical protein
VPTGREVCSFIQEALPTASIQWSRSVPQNFDDIAQAISTLLQVGVTAGSRSRCRHFHVVRARGRVAVAQISTTEGWMFVTLAAVDARGIDQQPVRDANRVRLAFFITFMVRPAPCEMCLCLCCRCAWWVGE